MKVQNQINKPSNGFCQLHTIEYYNLEPRAVNYITLNSELQKIALCRDDASIEIWDVSVKPKLEKVIANVEGASVETLSWCNDRLFSGGLAGDITEWNLKLLAVKQTTLVTGTTVWCMDSHNLNKQIVAGTEDGFLNLFNVIDEGLSYEKILDRQEGRILCCKFDHSGNIIVTGSVDVIRIWNKTTGHVLHKMTTGRIDKLKETIVWSLHVLKDLTIVSGDSRGRVTFWNGNIGSQIDSYIASKADILCVTGNENDDKIFCSGLDPLVKTFSYTTIKKMDQTITKWVETSKRKYHINDVKTMVCFKNYLLTGSVDGYIVTVTATNLKTIKKCAPLIQDPVVICDSQRLTLFKYKNYIEIWRLGHAKDSHKELSNINSDMASGNIVSLKEIPQKLLALKSRNNETILCANISPNGRWVVYSTNSFIRIFQFQCNSDAVPNLSQLKVVPEEFTPSHRMVFSKNSNTLFAYSTAGIIKVFEILNNDIIDFKQSIEIGKFVKDVVNTMVIDDSGKYLVCAGLCGNIGVWSLKENGLWSHYINLPKYKIPATALAIRPNSLNVAVVFSDTKIYEYNLENLEFSFSAYITFPFQLVNGCNVDHICFDPRNDNVFILAYEFLIGVLNKQTGESDDQSKRLRSLSSINENEMKNYSVQTVKYYNHLLIDMAWLGDNEMVVTEVNPLTLVEQSAPALRKKCYGVS